MPFECSQGIRADVMLDALGIHFRDAIGNPKASKEIDNRFVPAFARDGKRAPFFSEKNRAIRLGSNQAGILQTCDGSIDRNVGDAEAFGEIHDPRFAKFCHEVRNGFDVIFGNLVGMLTAGLGQVLCLAFAADAWFSGCFPCCHEQADQI